jgi:NAD(P)-dependent dehydrogenase (short-subunit alcohol dehydrogenase family)
VARRLAAGGAKVAIADVDATRGAEIAHEVGGIFIDTDVRSLEANTAAVAAAVEAFGGLDIVHLNAGISTGCGIGEDFTEAAYRKAMGINLDGVVFGVHAALPALKARGGGAIVATASLAGLTAMPMDPVYNANKHAVVGLVRGLGPGLAPDNITVNGLCPSFARTAIIDDIEEWLTSISVPILDVEEVVDAFEAILAGEGTGECWFVQPGRPAQAFTFRNVPGPRLADGGQAPGALAEAQVADGIGL